MKRPFATLAAVIFLLAAFPLLPGALAGEEEGPPSVSVDYLYFARLVPAFAHLYGGALDHFADISLANLVSVPVSLRVESWIEGVSRPVADLVEIAPRGTAVVHQDPDLIPEAVDALGTRRSGEFRVRVTLLSAAGETRLKDESGPLDLYARHDFAWIKGIGLQENLEMLAAWVTPDAPAVRALLRRAADHLDAEEPDEGYDGSEMDADWSVWQRLDAVWRVAEEYGLGLTGEEFVPHEESQPVRTPYDVLAGGGGNAVELALLYASAVEAMGLEAALFFASDRACVAVRQDRVNDAWYYVDTALLGADGFIKAREAGDRFCADALSRLEAGEEGYAWLDVAGARAKGILPQPWSQDRAGSDDTLEGETADPVEIRYVYNEDLITAFYHLYGTVLDDFLDVYLTNGTGQRATVMVESWIEDYSMTAVNTVGIDPGEGLKVSQNPRLKTDAVEALNSQRPGSFNLRVTQLREGADDLLLSESSEITIYSRRDFVWTPGFSIQEQYEMTAAWVTPNDPAVEELLRRAADYTDSGIIFSGYGEGELDEDGSVWDRLEAIWEAEEEYDIIYVSTMETFGPGYAQRIRTPREVLEQGSGNCIETTLLFASSAEAIGLETAMILIPGHAYVTVRQDEVNAMYWTIETTMIGRNSFTEAVNAGYDNWQRDMPLLEAGEPGYYWVDFDEARERGITPMPWR